MPVTYHVSPDHRLLETRVEGQVTVAEIEAYMAALEATPGYRGDFDAIIDVRDVTSLMGTEEMRHLGALVRGRDPALESRRAIVTGDQDVVYGLIRQFESYAEGGPTRYRAFRRMADAVSWLGLAPGALRHVRVDDAPHPSAGPAQPAREADARGGT